MLHMQMQATVSKGFVFTSLTVLKHAFATLFLAHLPHSSESCFKFQVGKDHGCVDYTIWRTAHFNEHDTNEFAHKQNREEKPKAGRCLHSWVMMTVHKWKIYLIAIQLLRCMCVWRKRVSKGWGGRNGQVQTQRWRPGQNDQRKEEKVTKKLPIW